MRDPHGSIRGLTIAEVMIAIVVLMISLTAIVGGLTAGDRARGKGRSASIAAMLAQSETERIRSQALVVDTISDTLYQTIVAKRGFDVTRMIVPKDDDILKPGPKLQDIIVAVSRTGTQDTIVKVRLIQGILK